MTQGSWGHRLCMGSLLGRDTNGLLERPLGPYSLLVEGSHWPHPAGGDIFAEPLYQRIEHCLTTGSQGFGRSWHTSWALGLDSYSQYHRVVPTVASPNLDSHQVDRTMARMDEVMWKILMRVAIGLNRSLCSTQEGLNEALKQTNEKRSLSDWKGS